MRFHYEGHDRLARASHGTVEAATEADACAMLKQRGIFALKVKAEGEAFSTVLPDNQGAEPVNIQAQATPRGNKQASSSILNQSQGPAPDPLEVELFGISPEAVARATGGQAAIAATSPAQDEEPQPDQAPVDQAPPGQTWEPWQRDLIQGLEGASAVLRQIHEWHEDYKKAIEEKRQAQGPQIGGKTWAFIEASLEQASRDIIADALRSAAARRKKSFGG